MLLIKKMDRDPVFDLISLDILKEHIRQDDDYENEIIQAYYLAAIDYAEKYTNRYFTETNIIGYQRDYSSKILVPFDINEVVSVKARNNDTVVDIEFTFNVVSNEIEIKSDYKMYSDFEVCFSTGYKENELPKAIHQGILMLFATIYEVREDVSYGVTANKVPFKSTMMLDMYKLPISG